MENNKDFIKIYDLLSSIKNDFSNSAENLKNLSNYALPAETSNKINEIIVSHITSMKYLSETITIIQKDMDFILKKEKLFENIDNITNEKKKKTQKK